jgi:hypothetical protein
MTDLDLNLRTDADSASVPPPLPLPKPATVRPLASLGAAHVFAELAVAFVWLYYGVWCKLLRGCAEEDAILGALPPWLFRFAAPLRYGIGVLEALLALWVLSRKAPRLAAVVQTATILVLTSGAFAWAPGQIADPGRTIVLNVAFVALVGLVASRTAATASRADTRRS